MHIRLLYLVCNFYEYKEEYTLVVECFLYFITSRFCFHFRQDNILASHIQKYIEGRHLVWVIFQDSLLECKQLKGIWIPIKPQFYRNMDLLEKMWVFTFPRPGQLSFFFFFGLVRKEENFFYKSDNDTPFNTL